MIKRLRQKFVLINMTIVTVMLCIILGLIYHFTRASLESESIRMLENAANHPFELGAPNEFGEEVRLPYFTLYLGADGELVSTDGGYYDLSDEDFLQELLEEVSSAQQRIGVLKDYHLRYYRVETPANRCVIFADISSELTMLRHLIRTCAAIGVLAFLALLLVGIFLSKWTVAPVERAWRQQRQFVADASHELKTPLTVIMTNAELLEMDGANEVSRRKSVDAIRTMTGQMNGLIRQMLELARADASEKKAEQTDVDYSKLVSDAILPFEPVFFEKGLTLESRIEEKVHVRGNEKELRQVVEILLDNAQKYSAEGGTTRVTLSHRILTVANEGAAIPREELGHLFERFYRVDASRSREHNSGGYGLGLSIAETIVKRHHGKISATSEDGVNVFTVEL